jgi:hypothetical protein
MPIGDDWLVDPMIIYIDKTIAKALDKRMKATNMK